MNFIKSFSTDGTINIEEILLNEGFNKENDVFKLQILHNNYRIEIFIEEKQLMIELFEKGNIEPLKYSLISWRPHNFFERYAMLLEMIIKYNKFIFENQ